MSSLLWFWLGTIAGTFVGFGAVCLVASNNTVRQTETDHHE